MIYEMNLNAVPFEKMASGVKTTELRLFDGKRRKLDIGDKIIFTCIDDPIQKLAVCVKSLHRYASFEDLFNDIPIDECGFDSKESPEIASASMRKYYSDEQIRIYGVLGIRIELDDLKSVLKQHEEQKEAAFDRLFPDGMK